MNKTMLSTAIVFGFLYGNATMAQPSPSSSQFKNMIVFGDSLSDVGNNTWIYATGTPITSFDQLGNRYTWVNYLSEKLFQKPANYSNNLKASPLTDNISYAYASADTSSNYLNADWPVSTPVPPIQWECVRPGLLKNEQGIIEAACVPGVLQQVSLYLNHLNQAHETPSPSTVFFLWAGANDLFYNLPPQPTPEDVVRIVKQAVANLVQAKNTLLDSGVSPQQIYSINLPDLSKTPFAIKYGLKLTEISMLFNSVLQTGITTSDQSHPGLPATHLISMFDYLNQVVANPSEFGFTNTTEACTEKASEPVCQGYLFFNLKHPSAQMYSHIADYIATIIDKDRKVD